jgi:uncharacterized membrane protein YagU involved in acid resistance
MIPLRLLARRAGLIQRTVPQAVEESLAHRMGARGLRPVHHHLVDHFLHAGYGAMLGAVFAIGTGGARRENVGRGLGYGVATWLFGSGVVLPLMRAARPIWRTRPGESFTDLGAHLLFGAVTALVCRDLGRQQNRGATSDSYRRRMRVG